MTPLGLKASFEVSLAPGASISFPTPCLTRAWPKSAEAWLGKMLQRDAPNCPDFLRGVWWMRDDWAWVTAYAAAVSRSEPHPEADLSRSPVCSAPWTSQKSSNHCHGNLCLHFIHPTILQPGQCSKRDDADVSGCRAAAHVKLFGCGPCQ